MRNRLIIVLCTISLIGFLTTTRARAISGGVSISPSVEQLQLQPNQISASYLVSLTNNSKIALSVKVSTENFSNYNQNGGINFISSSEISIVNDHSLASSIKPSLTEMLLGPGQSINDPITIDNANQLSVGGHYGAIVFKISSLSAKGDSVVVNEAISSLIFVSTLGQGTQTTMLSTPLISGLVPSFPLSLRAVFNDRGNTQTVITGLAQIYNSKGVLVSQGNLNINSGLILPGSSRLFSVPLSRTSKKYLWPGDYRLKITYRNGSESTYTTYQAKFIYLNPWLLLEIILPLILIVCILIRIFKKSNLKRKTQKKLPQRPTSPLKSTINNGLKNVENISAEPKIIK